MKLKLNKKNCVGCGNCQMACPKFFEVGEDGRSHLKGEGKREDEFIEELEIKNEKDIKCAKEAAEACPMKCISLK